MENTSPSIQAVLFDCDGTLVDSEYAHYQGWKHALKHFGIDFPLSDYYQYVGNSVQNIASLLAETNGKGSPEQVLKMKQEFFRELCKGGLPLISPTVEFLKKLAEKKTSSGIKIGVCSAAKKNEVLSHLPHLGIEDLLDVVLSGQDDLGSYSDPEGVNKPKPYVYLEAMAKLGVPPSQTVVIEDSAIGVAAGVAAGCFTIAIPNEYTKHQDFQHADLQLETLAELEMDALEGIIHGAQV